MTFVREWEKSILPLNPDSTPKEYDDDHSVLAFTTPQHATAITDEFGNVLSKSETSQDRTLGYPLLDASSTEKTKLETTVLVFAKAIFDNGEYKYFVRCNSQGLLLDPWGLYSEQRHQKIKKAGQVIIREVNKKAFKLYLRFLRTRNKACLRQAEREAM